MRKTLMIICLMGLVLPIKTLAFTGSVNLSCNSNTLEVNTATNCTLTGYTNEEVTTVSSRLSASGNISITNISVASIWQGNADGGSIDLYTDNNKKGNFAIATFTIKSGSTAGAGNINVSSNIFSDASFNEYSISSKSLAITVKKTETTNKIETPKKEETTANTKPSINNNTNNNKTEVTEKADKQVDEKEDKSSDATLSSLILSEGSINFSKDITDYNIEVSNDVEKITITANPTNSKSKVLLPQDLTLKLGKNNFEIKVTAEDGTTKIYKLHITRLERVLSGNSNLKSLEIKGHNISFKSNKYVYDLKDINSSILNINAVAEDENAKVKIYGLDSIGEDDCIVIKVTAEDGTSSEYIIYANSIEKKGVNLSFIIVCILCAISLGINVFLIVKNKKNRL